MGFVKYNIKKTKGIIPFFLRLFGIRSLGVFQYVLILLITTIAISSLVVLGFWIKIESNRTNKNTLKLEENSLIAQEKKLKEEIQWVLTFIDYQKKNSPSKSVEEIQNEVLDYLKNLRFGEDGYVFINTYEGFALLFDGKRLTEPKNISTLTDPKGFQIFKKELELTQLPEGGTFQYLFKKITDSIPQPKISYVTGIDDWGWIIGTGEYIENLDAEIERVKNQLSEKSHKEILIAIAVVFIAFMFIIFLSFLAARFVQKELNFSFFALKKVASGEIKRHYIDDIFIKELKIFGQDLLQAEGLALQFGDIVDQSLNEIYIFRQDNLKFVHANKGALQNCGYSLEELQNLTPLDLKPSLRKKEFLEFLNPLLEKQAKHIQFETIHQRKDKSEYPVTVHVARAVFIQEDVFVAFIYDISEQKEAEIQLQYSQSRYLNLFENAPISLWEEDFTDSLVYLEAQLKHYNLPIEEIFEKQPEVLYKCSSMAKVIDVNSQTLILHEAKNKKELLGNLENIFTSESFNTFGKLLIALYTGDNYFSAEIKNKTFKGKEINVHLRWSFMSGNTDNSKKVIVSMVDLTNLRKSEIELKTSEARFRSIFENNHTVMLLIDPETQRFLDVNPSATAYYGYTRERFLNNITIDQINALSKEEIKAKMEEAKLNKNAFFDFKHRLSDGKIRDVEVHSSLINYENKQVFFTIVFDITEKKQAEKALKDAMKMQESIFRSAPVGIGVVSNRVFTEVNNRLCEMVGFSAEELLGKESKIIYPSEEEFNRIGKEKYEQIKEKGTGSVETVFKRKDGEILNVLLSSTPLNINDLEKGVTFSALDITSRVNDLKELNKYRLQLEETVNERTLELSGSQDALLNLVDDLNHQTAKLEKANSRLAEINEELETFTYCVSHDLKAPLRGIDGYSQLLLEDYYKELEPEAITFLLNIRKSTQQMALLIEDLLAYSRMERKDFVSEKIQLKGLIEDMILYYSKQIEKQKLKIKYSFPDNFKLSADKDGLNLIVRNFMDNAIKFTAQSEKPIIEIGGKETKEKWLIFVKDNGIGFDMKYHDRIFKIFQRLHLSEEFEGTGIGLAMVGKAAQRMKSKIWAESELGKGATFYLEIGK